MNKADLLEALLVERYAPSPRPVEQRTKPYAYVPPLTVEEQAENRRILAKAIGVDELLSTDLGKAA